MSNFQKKCYVTVEWPVTADLLLVASDVMFKTDRCRDAAH